jgi:DNA-binding winged helix-turn-helix (wHTH) protein
MNREVLGNRGLNSVTGGRPRTSRAVLYSCNAKEVCMPTPGCSPLVARFDVFEVDLRACELYKAGRKIKLQVLPFHALALLLERPGEVITREEFEKRLWPSDTFVDFDHSLNTAIKKLRQALDDNNKKPRFVETLPKRGYRFIGTVEQAPKVSASAKALAAETSRVGQVAKLCSDGALSFTLVSVDDETAAERKKLDAASDDVGLSLLIASQKLLIVPNGTQVRILEVQPTQSRCQVRILEGEHYGKAAVVPLKQLAEIP